MAFENLREQLKDRLSETLGKIQETSAFNTLRERYESQTPPVQRAILAGSIAFAVLFVLMWPYSYISSSSEQLNSFEENRELIQGLLRASRSAKEPSPLPAPMDPNALKMSVEQMLKQSGLVADQLDEINIIPDSEIKDVVPAGIVTSAVAARVKKLNLNQVVELSNMAQNMAPGNKLLGLDVIQSAGTTHYYDIILKVANFGLKPVDLGDIGEKPGLGSKKSLPNPKSKVDDLDAE